MKPKNIREAAARSLCRFDGHPENISFEGKPMWKSYLPQADAVLAAVMPEELEKVRSEEL
ncbi:hypothetical protein [Oryzifoliimicrobium ureilyticus]|uniref:hypothetical protein n=1 Tax=Oryzifoliimicrobium ureilyticus TaxID=3113724 RepID=UPI0030768787